MADHFLGALKELERRTHDNKLIFSEILSERLDALAESMVSQVLSDNDYMKVFELYYQKYQKLEKKKAMMYCILRIQQMAEYKKNVKLRNLVNKVEFSSNLDEYTREFLKKKRPYYKNMQIDFKKKVLLFGFILTTCFLILSVLVLKMSFLWGWILSVVFYFLIYFGLVKVGYPYFFETRLEMMQEELDPLCLALDMAVHSMKKET